VRATVAVAVVEWALLFLYHCTEPKRSKLTLTSARRTANSSAVPDAAHALAAHYFSHHHRPNPLEPLPQATTACPPTQCYILFRFEHRQTAKRPPDSECSAATLSTSAACPVRTLAVVQPSKDLPPPSPASSSSFIPLIQSSILPYCSSVFHPSTLAKSPQQLPLPEHPRPHPASAAHHLSHPTR
jgi:hypothetical protein